MIIEFDKSFDKCITKLKDKEVKDRLRQIIYSFDEAKSIHDIKNHYCPVKYISSLKGLKTVFNLLSTNIMSLSGQSRRDYILVEIKVTPNLSSPFGDEILQGFEEFNKFFTGQQ